MGMLKTAIGLMSGTSMDGIDAALLRTDGRSEMNILAHYETPYSAEFRQKLLCALRDAQAITAPGQRPGCLPQVERELTLLHAEAVKHLLEKQNLKAQDVDLIGFHGQTVLHRPPLDNSDCGFTVQLGDGALLAEAAGIAVVADMRAEDMQAGGNGAPLAPVYHRALSLGLADNFLFPVVFLNIGGIANATYIENSEAESADNLIAFDCGPGNCLLDQWAAEKTGKFYDAGGKAALRGKVSKDAVFAYFNLPIFRERRRSYDRGDFPPLESLTIGQELSYEDGAATLAYITAKCAMESFAFLPERPKALIVSGGGAKNHAIMRNLVQLSTARGIQVGGAESFGLSSSFMEAEAWGYLAVRSFYHLPLTYPGTTGCREATSGGILYPAPAI